MADERQNGLMCPECGAAGSLRVKWTSVKTVFMRRYVFKCQACGAAVKGYLEIEEVLTTAAQQKNLERRVTKGESVEGEEKQWCSLL